MLASGLHFVSVEDAVDSIRERYLQGDNSGDSMAKLRSDEISIATASFDCLMPNAVEREEIVFQIESELLESAPIRERIEPVVRVLIAES